MQRIILTGLLIIVASARSAVSETAPAPPAPGPPASLGVPSTAPDPHNLFHVNRKQPFLLSITDAVQMAVQSNLEIAAAAFDPLIRATDEDTALSAFDPLYFANFSVRDAETPTSSSLSGASNLTQRNTHADTGLRKQMLTGGTYEMRVDLDRQKSNSIFSQLNPSFTANATIEANQPLLRGAGVSRNLAQWKIARNSTTIASEMEEGTVANAVAIVQKAYWDLVFTIGDLTVRQLSLTRAQKFLDESKQRFAVGAIIELDVINAGVDVARREEDLLLAQRRLKDAEDRLKFQIRPLDPNFLENFDLRPTTAPTSVLPEVKYLERQRSALEQRWALRQSRLELANLDILVKTAEQDLLPRLDLTGSFALNALADHLDNAVDDLDNGDFQTWSMGLHLEVPLGNRGARASLRRSQLQMKQALVRHKNLEERVLLEVRIALRNVAAQGMSLKSAEQGRKLAALQLEKEEARYQEGLSTAFQVLDFQEDLASAESNELQTQVDFEKALVDLDLATAETLVKNGIVREEVAQTDPKYPPPPAPYSRFGDLVDPKGSK